MCTWLAATFKLVKVEPGKLFISLPSVCVFIWNDTVFEVYVEPDVTTPVTAANDEV